MSMTTAYKTHVLPLLREAIGDDWEASIQSIVSNELDHFDQSPIVRIGESLKRVIIRGRATEMRIVIDKTRNEVFVGLTEEMPKLPSSMPTKTVKDFRLSDQEWAKVQEAFPGGVS